MDGSQSLLTTSARAAIALALEQLEIGPGEEVLLPAYHCLAMRVPIEARGAVPVFYRVDEQLNIDLADLETRLSPRSRCVMTVHFFGFPQDHAPVRRLCDRHGLSLIEDCAHAFYGPRDPQGSQLTVQGSVAAQGSVPAQGCAAPQETLPSQAAHEIGRSGDFAVGSLMKFFPVFDGGCLVSFRRPLKRTPLSSPGALFQLKALANMIERAGKWHGPRALRWGAALLAGATRLAKAARPQLASQLADSAPGAAQGSLGFQQEWVHTPMSAASRLVLRLSNHRRAIERRREIFAEYAAGLGSVEGGRPLRSDLPEGVVPYVFPFILSAPDIMYPALRAAGVPVYRWEEVAEEPCATARYYKTRLVQFPCHQSLEQQEVVDLIRTIRQVLATCSDTPFPHARGAAP